MPAWIAGSGFHQVAKLETCRSCRALDQLCGERPHGGKESGEEPEGFGGACWACGNEMK